MQGFHWVSQVRGTVTDGEQIEKALKIIRRRPVKNKLKEIRVNPALTPQQKQAKSSEVIANYEKHIDSKFQIALGGKKLFPCQLPANPTLRPKLVLSGEMHKNDDARNRVEALLAQASGGKRLCTKD